VEGAEVNVWQIVLIVLLFALWVWALVAVFIDVFRRSDLSGAVRVGWVALVLVLPVVGVLIYMIARPKLTEPERRSVAAYDDAVHPGGESTAEQIADLARLRAEGKITDEEFEERKRRMV
jgi:predicted membrane channel-forming protein YqfA (hemolysin III family)